jgi:hypothetical protein
MEKMAIIYCSMMPIPANEVLICVSNKNVCWIEFITAIIMRNEEMIVVSHSLKNVLISYVNRNEIQIIKPKWLLYQK